MSYKQNNWPLAINTPLGDNAFHVTSVTGSQAMSDMFSFQVDVILMAAGSAVSASVLGQSVTIRIGLPSSESGAAPPRLLNGFVVNCGRLSDLSGSPRYRFGIVPWMWFLTRASNCQIFQNKTAPDIISAVYSALGFSAYKSGLQSTYPSLDYCVQYRETYFNFVSRLMEFNGIYYFFTHANGAHTLQMVDTNSACPAIAGSGNLDFGISDKFNHSVDLWYVNHEIQPGKFTYGDFNFTTPGQMQTGQVNNSVGAPQGALEMFEFPGGFPDSSTGANIATTRMQEFQSDYEVFSGSTNCWNVEAGHTFTLQNHPIAALNKKYLLTEVAFNASQSVPVEDRRSKSESRDAQEFTYAANIKAIDFKQQYRPKRKTPRPSIPGPQTAFVSGQSGKEIYTDSYGRIKVQFHWDRYGQADENASCWIRVAQLWAGNGWGSLFIPRVGQEVVVEFLDGDPDRPLITGCVYNAVNTPPYTLPDNATQSGLKTNSSTGGNGANELKFDDTAGSENIFLHAQFDMHHRVKNKHFLSVEKESHTTIGGASYAHHKDALHITTDGKHLESIGDDRNLTVTGNEMIKVAGTNSNQVTGNVSMKFGANCYQEVAQQNYIKADTIILEAATNITLKVGNTTIALDSSGITIACGEFEVDGQSSAKLTVSSTALTLSSSDGKLAVGASSLDLSSSSASLSSTSVSLGS